jgi:hypothetical protein
MMLLSPDAPQSLVMALPFIAVRVPNASPKIAATSVDAGL